MRYEIVNAVLLLQYETRISSLMFLAMGSYFVLPLIAASIQAVYYGWALIDLAIGISMVLMFLVAAKEQSRSCCSWKRAGHSWRKSWRSPRC